MGGYLERARHGGGRGPSSAEAVSGHASGKTPAPEPTFPPDPADAVRAYAGTLKPVVARHWAALAPALQPLADKLCLCVDSLLEDINASLGLWAPWQLVLLTVVATALLSWVLDAAQHAKHTLQDKGAAGLGKAQVLPPQSPRPSGFPKCCTFPGHSTLLFPQHSMATHSAQHCSPPHTYSPPAGVTQVLARLAFRLPVLRGIVAAKEQKVVDDLEESMKKGAAPDALHELPPAGTPAADLKRRLGAKVCRAWALGCVDIFLGGRSENGSSLWPPITVLMPLGGFAHPPSARYSPPRPCISNDARAWRTTSSRRAPPPSPACSTWRAGSTWSCWRPRTRPSP